MCPATQSRDRNPFLWYFIGLISFYIPFAVVGFVPPVLILMLMKRGMEIPASFFDLLGVASFLLAVILGLAYLDHVKAFVLSAPRSSRS